MMRDGPTVQAFSSLVVNEVVSVPEIRWVRDFVGMDSKKLMGRR